MTRMVIVSLMTAFALVACGEPPAESPPAAELNCQVGANLDYTNLTDSIEVSTTADGFAVALNSATANGRGQLSFLDHFGRPNRPSLDLPMSGGQPYQLSDGRMLVVGFDEHALFDANGQLVGQWNEPYLSVAAHTGALTEDGVADYAAWTETEYGGSQYRHSSFFGKLENGRLPDQPSALPTDESVYRLAVTDGVALANAGNDLFLFGVDHASGARRVLDLSALAGNREAVVYKILAVENRFAMLWWSWNRAESIDQHDTRLTFIDTDGFAGETLMLPKIDDITWNGREIGAVGQVDDTLVLYRLDRDGQVLESGVIGDCSPTEEISTWPELHVSGDAYGVRWTVWDEKEAARINRHLFTLVQCQ